MPECADCAERVAPGTSRCPACDTPVETDEPLVTDGGQADGAESGSAPAQQSAGEDQAEPNRPAEGEETDERPPELEPLAAGVAGGLSAGQKVLFAGIGLTLLGAFLPWVTFQAGGAQQSMTGLAGDGVLTLGVGLGTAPLVAFRWDKLAKVAAAIGGVLIGALALAYVVDPTTGVDNPADVAAASAGLGVYVTVLGGGAIVAGAVIDWL